MPRIPVGKWDSLPPRRQAALGAALIAVLAGCLRLIGLARHTPGFGGDEATIALMAQRIHRDNLPVFFGQEQDALPPLFPYLVKITGTLGGWGVAGPRAAAALCGITAAVACALWLARALGPFWGLLGGLLAASSFWQIMFSRQAVPPISTALFVSIGLWLAWIGLERGSRRQPDRIYRRRDLLWYICAGAAFGAGFHTDASYAAVPPLVLLTAGVLALNQLRANREGDALGPALLLLAMVVAMTPLASYYLDYPDDFRRALDLAAGLPEDLADTGDDVAAGFRGVIWRGSENPATNLPGRALLDPLLALWTGVGFVAAIRHPTRTLEGTLLVWGLLGVFAIGLIGGDNPALYLPLAPLLVAFPLFGMWTAWEALRDRPLPARAMAGILIAASVAISAGWSIYDYFWQWSESPETYVAMRGDLRDALAAADALPDDDIPIYITSADAYNIVEYLGPARLYHQIETRQQISIPFDDDAYLVAPRSTQPVPQLRAYLAGAELLDSGSGQAGETSYRIWLVGPRTRDGLPYAVPSIPFENGWLLGGFDARAGPTPSGAQPEIDVVLVWQVPRDGDPFVAEARLVPAGDQSGEFITANSVDVMPWKLPAVLGGEFLLAHVRLPFPRTGDFAASLQVGLRNPATGELVTPLLNAQDDGYAFLNDLQIVVP